MTARYLRCTVFDLLPADVAEQARSSVALREMAFTAAMAEAEAKAG